MHIKESNKWVSANFDRTIKDLVGIKFQCLHCLKYNRQKVVIDSYDIKTKFNDAKVTYQLRNRSENRSKNRSKNIHNKHVGNSNKNIIENTLRQVG